MSIVRYDKYSGFYTTTLLSQFYFRVNILLAYEIHLLDHISPVSVDAWDHIACFNPAIFLQKNLYQCQKCEQVYMCQEW